MSISAMKVRRPGGYGINLPITPQTDPRNFPEYEYREYPKMILIPARKEDIQAWRDINSYVDTASGRVSYMGAAPRLNSLVPLRANQEDVDAGFASAIGKELIARNLEEERILLHSHGLTEAMPMAKKVSVQLPEAPAENFDPEGRTIAEVEAENAALEAALKRNAELKAAALKMADETKAVIETRKPVEPVSPVIAKKKRGRPPKNRAPETIPGATDELPKD